MGEQGWHSGESAIASHQCGPDSIPAWCHMLVEFAVGSCLAPKVFLWVLQFSSLHKNLHSKLQFDQARGPAWKPAKADVTSSLNVVIFNIDQSGFDSVLFDP